jgi:hypothetical protein
MSVEVTLVFFRRMAMCLVRDRWVAVRDDICVFHHGGLGSDRRLTFGRVPSDFVAALRIMSMSAVDKARA